MKQTTANMKNVLLACLVLLVAPLVASGGEFSPSKLAGVNTGVACVFGASDPEIVFNLAKDNRFMVLVVDPDQKAIDSLRDVAMEKGLLNRGVYVHCGKYDTVPLANNYVDLLVCAGLNRADYTPQLAKECGRILSPVLGKGVFKNAEDAWLSGIPGLAGKPEQKPEGLSVVSKGELPGSDWWTHRFHGPGNNPVSQDKAFSWDGLQLQYQQMPFFSSAVGGALTADGMQFELNDWNTKDSGNVGMRGLLVARSLSNGRIRWSAKLPEQIEVSCPNSVYVNGRVLVASGTKNEIVRYRASDGSLDEPIALPADTRAKWIAHLDGRLYVLLGGEAKVREGGQFPLLWESQIKGMTLFGTRIVCIDLATLKTIWTHEAPTPIDFRLCGVQKDGLVCYRPHEELLCLDPVTGQVLWRQDKTGWITKLVDPSAKIEGAYNFIQGLLLDGEYGYIRMPLKYMSVNNIHAAFNTRDGSLRWLNTSLSSNRAFITDGAYGLAGTLYGAKDGTKLPQQARLSFIEGCGIVTYNQPSQAILGHKIWNDRIKAPCPIGVWTAGGIIAFPPPCCACASNYRGSAAVASDSQTSTLPLNPTQQPVTGPAIGANATGAGQAVKSAPIGLSAPAAVRWQYEPAHSFAIPVKQDRLHWEYRLNPPVTADGRVYVSGDDGVLRVFALQDGKLLWQKSAPAGAWVAPRIVGGLVIHATADGTVSAYRSTDGVLAWSFQVAPFDRRIFSFDRLVSRWPLTGLIVDDAGVIAVCGQWSANGLRVVALDAATGRLQWEHVQQPKLNGVGEDGCSPNGGLFADTNEVWIGSSCTVPLVLDRRNGQPLKPVKGPFVLGLERWMRHGIDSTGSDMLALDKRFLLHGGDPQWGQPGAEWVRAGHSLLVRREEGGLDPRFPKIFISNWGRATPAIDPELVVYFGENKLQGGKKNTLVCWQREKFLACAESIRQRVAAMTVTLGNLNEHDRASEQAGFSEADNQAAWLRDDLKPIDAIALSADAVLVVHNSKGRIEPNNWKLSALDRTTGATKWSTPLPAEPVVNGMRVAEDGSIVLALRGGGIVCLGSKP